MGASTSKGSDPLRGFKFERVLNDNPNHKSVTLLGKCKKDASSDEQTAIVILERLPFETSEIGDFFQHATINEEVLQNDIYTNYKCTPPPKSALVLSRFICPAREDHIRKYSVQRVFMINETPELYAEKTLPWIESLDPKKISWVFNILDGVKEADRVIYSDPDPATGFVLLPDLKWNQTDPDNLYCLAIVRDRRLRSIRDLRGEHLAVLQNVRDAGSKAIGDKYGVPANQMRVFFHYVPTYYHLHVHFTHLRFEAFGTYSGKAHLLDDVIGNLSRDPEHYQKCSIGCVIGAEHPLLRLLAPDDARAEDGAKSGQAQPASH